MGIIESMRLDGKAIYVTGAASGIGKAAAAAFAEAGADVAIVDINLEGAEKVAKEIAEATGSKTIAIQCDVTKKDQVEAMVAKVVDTYGKLDILVNNAGITRDGLLMKMSEEDFDAVVDTNLKGAFNCIRFASRQMLKQRSGRIISLSSVVGVYGNAGQANYSASKAGIIGLTKSAARELAGRGITVNAVAPGFIETEMTEVLSEKVKEAAKAQIPFGTFGQPEDIANAFAFLASDEASYITGVVLSVDGMART